MEYKNDLAILLGDVVVREMECTYGSNLMKGLLEEDSAMILESMTEEQASRIRALQRLIVTSIEGIKADIPQINCGSEVALYNADLRHKTVEHFRAMYLDCKNNVIKVDTIGIGSDMSCAIDLKRLLRAAISCSAYGVVLVHNHPSGDCKPSNHDMTATKNIKKALKAIGVALRDHVIVGGDTYYSMLQHKVL